MWKIVFKIQDKEARRKKKRSVIANIDVTIPTKQLSNMWNLINSLCSQKDV